MTTHENYQRKIREPLISEKQYSRKSTRINEELGDVGNCDGDNSYYVNSGKLFNP